MGLVFPLGLSQNDTDLLDPCWQRRDRLQSLISNLQAIESHRIEASDFGDRSTSQNRDYVSPNLVCARHAYFHSTTPLCGMWRLCVSTRSKRYTLFLSCRGMQCDKKMRPEIDATGEAAIRLDFHRCIKDETRPGSPDFRSSSSERRDTICNGGENILSGSGVSRAPIWKRHDNPIKLKWSLRM